MFDPGQGFTKTWRVRNAGTCTWSGYSAVYQDGDPLGAQASVALPGSVAPGDTVDISIKMTAPQKPGNYYSDWLISASDGTLFGMGAGKNGLLWTKIGVRTLLPVTGGTPTCAFQTDPTVEGQILQLINQARQQNGLTAYTLSTPLSTAARAHSQDMACNNFVDHYGSDGSTWYGRIQAQSVRY
jgi:Ig-like domain from next to BRCA1 gene/Cysteine-rich secretory protein family